MLYSSGKIHDAFACLKSSEFEIEGFTSKEKIEFYNLSINIKKKLELSIVSTVEECIENLIVEKDALAIVKFYEENLVRDLRFSINHKIFKSYILIGEIAEAKKLSTRMLSKLLDEKLFDQAMIFIQEMNDINVPSSKLMSAKFRVMIEKGETSVFDHISTKYEYDIFMSELELSNHKNEWLRKYEYKKLALSLDLEDEEFFSSCLQILIHEPKEKDTLFLLLRKSFELKRKQLCDLLIKVLSEKYFSDLLTVKQRDELLVMGMEVRNFEEFDYRDEIDLGTDLFAIDILTEEQEIENRINFLIQMGEEEKAEELINELKARGSDSTLISDFEDEKLRKKGSKALAINRDITTDFTKIINKYSQEHEEKTSEMESYVKKLIENSSKEELDEQYYDLSIALLMMELPTIVVSMIESLNETEDLKEIVKREYLIVNALFQDKEYYKALNRAEAAIDEIPFTEDERIDFYYIVGECYRKIGRKLEAMKYYARVFAVDKNYRLVKQRLNEIR